MVDVITPECREFLLYGTRTAKLATVRVDGRPHVVPVWFLLDGDDIVFNTGTTSVKARNIRHDPRVALSVDDEQPLYSFAFIEGVATISEDMDSLLYWATRIGARYMGEDKAEAFGKRNAVEGELIIRVRPIKATFVKDLAG